MKIAIVICVICAICVWALCRAAGQEDEKFGRK